MRWKSVVVCAALAATVARPLWAEESASTAIDWYGDLRLRAEQTSDIPGRADDIERLRAALRIGGRLATAEGWEFAVAAKLGAGSDDNADNRRNKDNEKSNGVGLDELYLAYGWGDAGLFRIGKGQFPLVHTPLIFDRDLRPVGAHLEYRWAVADFDALHLTAGYFAGDHLYGDESRVGALQIGYGWMEGAPTSVSAFLSYLDFDDTGVLAREGLARTNRRLGGVLLSDYRLLDLLLIAQTRVAEAPLVARLDLVRNLGAEDQRDGARFSLVWGDALDLGGWEIGYSTQRAQRDAVLAAFAEDDWWFQSFARGYMPWVAYGLAGRWSLQLSAFIERRDGIEEPTDRYLLDLRSRW